MTNFLSEQDFEKFLNSLRHLLESNQKTLAQVGRGLVQSVEAFIVQFELLYGSALRVSESFSIYPEDLSFDKNILTLNHTKTGFKKCKNCKGASCDKCQGLGKIRKAQHTTIHPKFKNRLYDYVAKLPKGRPIFKGNRITLWSYAKRAGEHAGLNVFEQQDERLITGVWTHLFRKSRAQQMMLDKSDSESSDYVWELVKIKLRHSAKGRDVTFRYTNKIGQKLGLNDLLEWEQKHYGYVDDGKSDFISVQTQQGVGQ
jgi:integrase